MGKRLTNKEKQHNKEIKKELQAAGLLPPDKPRLNRKKFVEEAVAAWDGRDKECIIWDVFIMKAITYLLGHSTCRTNGLSLEAVGAAKVLMVALRLQEFQKGLEEQGQKQYRIVDEFNFIKDILYR